MNFEIKVSPPTIKYIKNIQNIDKFTTHNIIRSKIIPISLMEPNQLKPFKTILLRKQINSVVQQLPIRLPKYCISFKSSNLKNVKIKKLLNQFKYISKEIQGIKNPKILLFVIKRNFSLKYLTNLAIQVKHQKLLSYFKNLLHMQVMFLTQSKQFEIKACHQPIYYGKHKQFWVDFYNLPPLTPQEMGWLNKNFLKNKKQFRIRTNLGYWSHCKQTFVEEVSQKLKQNHISLVANINSQNSENLKIIISNYQSLKILKIKITLNKHQSSLDFSTLTSLQQIYLNLIFNDDQDEIKAINEAQFPKNIQKFQIQLKCDKLINQTHSKTYLITSPQKLLQKIIELPKLKSFIYDQDQKLFSQFSCYMNLSLMDALRQTKNSIQNLKIETYITKDQVLNDFWDLVSQVSNQNAIKFYLKILEIDEIVPLRIQQKIRVKSLSFLYSKLSTRFNPKFFNSFNLDILKALHIANHLPIEHNLIIDFYTSIIRQVKSLKSYQASFILPQKADNLFQNVYDILDIIEVVFQFQSKFQQI